MQPIPWRLLDCVWRANERCVPIEALEKDAWPAGAELNTQMLDIAKRRANHVLRSLGFPMHLRIKGAYVWLA